MMDKKLPRGRRSVQPARLPTEASVKHGVRGGELRAVEPAPIRVYLAGKIAPGDWRRGIVDVRDRFSQSDVSSFQSSWPVLPGAIFGRADYCGPYFVGCDHGGFHGPATHGAGVSGAVRCCAVRPHETPTREAVRRLCITAIGRCDLFFAWLDSADAHGTLVEVGWAEALGKRIAIAATPEWFASHGREHWFALGAAVETIPASTPIEGFLFALTGAMLAREAAASVHGGRP